MTAKLEKQYAVVSPYVWESYVGSLTDCKTHVKGLAKKGNVDHLKFFEVAKEYKIDVKPDVVLRQARRGKK